MLFFVETNIREININKLAAVIPFGVVISIASTTYYEGKSKRS